MIKMISTFPFCVTWTGKPTISDNRGQVTAAHKRLAKTKDEARKFAVELSKDKANCTIIVWSEVERLRWDIDYTQNTELQEDLF